jgi:hypothetical protein
VLDVVLDSNLLLLLVVGLTDPAYISKHKRLSAYTAEDFELLQRMLSTTRSILVTPNILTETSNLAGQIADPARSQIYTAIRGFVGFPTTNECVVLSTIAVQDTCFLRLGLTDVAILEVLQNSHTLLTADLDLYLAAMARGMKATNFNHFRF